MTHDPKTRPLAMIVDDATTVRMYHLKLVEDCGWDVIEAENGMEAVERAAGQAVDLMDAIRAGDVPLPPNWPI